MTMTFTRGDVLARITVGPTRFCDLAGSKAHRVRAPLRHVVDQLTSEGVIRKTSIGGIPHLVLQGWDFSDELRLQEIEGRCRRLLDGCLEWPGYLDPRRGPMGCIGDGASPTSVRRMVWVAKRGPLDFQQTVRVTCGNERCVEYRCLCLGRREDKGVGKSITPLHRARIARAQQARAKLDWDKVRVIRASSDDPGVLAERYGVSTATVSQVLRHETWRESGFFTALLQGRATA
jgi:hypothetical protein